MKARIIKTVFVEAARRLPGVLPDGEGYTGDRYRIDLIAEGAIDPDIGWVVDYGDMKRFFDPVRKQLDHCCLNDIPELAADASVEALEQWINKRLRPWPEWFAGARVSPCGTDIFILHTLPPDDILDLPERAAFSFSAAQALPQLPEGHPCRNLHGHNYVVEVAAEAMDRLSPALMDIHGALHDSYLNRIPGLEQATAERIAAWIWDRLVERGMMPVVVAVQETPYNRCHYYGG